MLKSRNLAACLIALLLVAPASAVADNEGLYGLAVPDDAVFLRWLVPGSSPVAFGAAFAPGVASGTDYAPVSAAALEGATPGGFYTILPHGVIPEPARPDPGKVYLILLHAEADPAAAPARLVVAGQGPEIVGATAPGTAQARGVNPVEATVAVMAGDAVLGTFELALRRGQNLTFVVEGGRARLIENGFGPVATPR